MAFGSQLEQIKERVPILDLVGQRVKLQKSGRNYKGLCPFHDEKTPSFYVFPDRENWHCFGCGLGGDAFGFVMRTENVEFTEALRLLAARAGVELAPRASRKAEEDRHRRLYEINAAATRYFQSMLFTKEGEAALAYMLGRGLSRETLESFQIGWAPDRWDGLLTRLAEQGYPVEELAQLGLVIARESGGHYDRFRARVTFPIADVDANVIGFGGRAMGDAQPKYLNSSDSPVFQKGATLYGLDRARAAIKRDGIAVVVEGYMDAIVAHQAGITNVVASLGTSLTEQHLLTLKRLASKVVLALDADAAGDAAALRTLEVLRGTFGKMAVPVADRQGLVRLRRDQELDLRVARLPAGQDPDDVIRGSPEAFRQLVAEAKPIVEVLIDAEVARAGSEIAARAAAADAVLDFLKDVPNPVVADGYSRMLAERLGVDYEALRGRLNQLRNTARRRSARQAPSAGVTAEAESEMRDWLTLEEYLLRLMLSYPGRARGVLPELGDEDFFREDARAVFARLRDALAAGGDVDAADVLGELDEPLADYAEWVVRWGDDMPEPDESFVDAEIDAAATKLRMLNHRREIAMIALYRRDLDREGDLTGWPQQSARVAELLTQVRDLERRPGVRYNAPWAAILRDEARLGPMRSLPRPRSEEPAYEPPAAAAG